MKSENKTIFDEVCTFLSNPDAFGDDTKHVDIVRTHGAIVFLGKHTVFKIKQPVHYDYMDFSTLTLRKAVCLREIEINQPHAPQIYLGLVAVTREADDCLAIDGLGEPIEWAVHMRKFPQDNLLSSVAKRGDFDRELAAKLGKQIADFHSSIEAEPVGQDSGDGAKRISEIIEELDKSLHSLNSYFPIERLDYFLDHCSAEFENVQDDLTARALAGMVRRCHGDLHLSNIVLLDDQPVLFDALEFDEQLATIDVLYDLAFLVMDLIHLGLKQQANIVFNRYVLEAWLFFKNGGLCVFPLFLALRAGIRAMVSAQAAERSVEANDTIKLEALSYLEDGCGFFEGQAPVLVAVGGLSGTGKSTLATRLASQFGQYPGAVWLRSDLIRKHMFGVGEYETLPDEAYSEQVSEKVYKQMQAQAVEILSQGYAVLMDAVFAKHEERVNAYNLALRADARFCGIWLEAPAEILISRVKARTNDASDADEVVVRKQLDNARADDLMSDHWQRVDASGTAEETLNNTQQRLTEMLGLQFKGHVS